MNVKKAAIFQLSNYRYSPFARHLANIAPEFQKRGVQLDLLVSAPEGMDAVPESVRSIVLGQFFPWLKRAPRHYFGVFELAAYFKRERPDAVICRGVSFAVPALIARMLASHKPVLVMTLHSDLHSDISNKVYRSAFMLRRLARIAVLRCDRSVPVSDGIRQSYLGLSAGGDKKLTTIYNPVVSDELLAASRAEVHDAWLDEGRNFKTLVMVARLAPEKDHATTFKALARIRRSQDVRLLVIGGGPLLEHLRSNATELGIGEAVRFLGRLENPYAFMRQADALVLSSTTEGLPGVLIQAMAVGCPVVAADCPWGPAEILEGGKWGPLVPVGDPEALADAILDVLFDPPPREALERRAREFSATASVDKLLALMDSLVAARSGMADNLQTTP